METALLGLDPSLVDDEFGTLLIGSADVGHDAGEGLDLGRMVELGGLGAGRRERQQRGRQAHRCYRVVGPRALPASRHGIANS